MANGRSLRLYRDRIRYFIAVVVSLFVPLA